MLPCWLQRLRTMKFLFCYFSVLQILCFTIVSCELQKAMKDEFIYSENSVLLSVWREQPSVTCNLPKPPENSLENTIFLAFSFDQFLCVILYDISYRYAQLLPDEPPHNSEKIAQRIISSSPPPEVFCQNMKEKRWSTDTEENKKWFLKFNDVMNDTTLCNKYCLSDLVKPMVVNPLCAYILWLDSSMKIKLQQKSSVLINDNLSRGLLPDNHSKLYQRKQHKVQEHQSEHLDLSPLHPVIQNNGAPSSIVETSPSVFGTTAVSPKIQQSKSPTKENPDIEIQRNYPNFVTNNEQEIVKSEEPSQYIQGLKDEISPKLLPSELRAINSHALVRGDEATISESKKHKPTILVVHELQKPAQDELRHNSAHEGENRGSIENKSIRVPDHENIQQNFAISNSAATITDSPKIPEISTNTKNEMQEKSAQSTVKDQQSVISTSIANKVDTSDLRKSENTPKFGSSKQDHINSANPGANTKQTSVGTDINTKENKIESSETKPAKPPLEHDDKPTGEGISDGIGAAEPDNHESPKDMEEAEGEGELIAENPDDLPPEGDVTSPTHLLGESDNSPIKLNTSPKDYGGELSDEDPPMPINGEQDKGLLNDAGAGIYVHDRFVDAEDSHFFAYFMTMIILCIIGYLIFHNKQKILALALEGRVRKGNRRRPSTSGYRKLDSNLEEAVTSNCSGASVTHVIY